MSRMMMIAIVAAALASPLSAQFRTWDQELRIRGGLFTPDGGSDYWDGREVDFSGDAGDLEDAFFGVDYRHTLAGGPTSLMFSVDSYEGEDVASYLDFVDQDGFPIRHRVSLEVSSVTLAWTARLAPPRSPLVPYVGVGGGIYSWSLEEVGDFIDFGAAEPEVFGGGFGDEGTTLGWYLVGGLDVTFGSGLSFFAEGRWSDASDELGGDFDGFGDLELSGLQVGGGVGWKF